MNKIYQLVFVAIAIFLAASVSAQNLTEDRVVMGASYENDVFYSLEDGIVKESPRKNWDIAFGTGVFDATIITNGGAGVKLYAYPKGDITAWDDVDTTGLYQWKVLYNSPKSWFGEGAFNQNSTGGFDYGWGIYQQNNNHKVVGDSLFIIKTGDDYLKLRIDEKDSKPNIYRFTFANLDGSNEIHRDIEMNPYTAKDFLYFSLANDEIQDREPTEDWDLLFTLSIDDVYMGEKPVKYPVVSVLQKSEVLGKSIY